MRSEKKFTFPVSFILTLFLLTCPCTTDYCSLCRFLPVSEAHAQTADEYVQLGRQSLESHDITEANAHFLSALGQTPQHPEANFYYSVTRILALSATNEVNTLLDGFGVPETGRDLFNWTARLPTDASGRVQLPANSPTGGDITVFINTLLLPEINAALVNLEVLDAAASERTEPITILTTAMTDSDRDLEIDFGDVALYRSGLLLTKSLLLFITSYNLDADIDDIANKSINGTIDIRTHIIDAYPALLTLRNSEMPAAKQSLTDGIDALTAALNFMLMEEDAQSDDFVFFDPADIADVRLSIHGIAQIRNSLTNTVSDPFSLELSRLIHLGRFFDNPFQLRDLLYTDGIKKLLKEHIGYQVNRAIMNLAGIDASFQQTLSPDQFPVETAVEVDFGDVALVRSGLYAVRSFIQTIDNYNMNADVYDIINALANETFSINTDILEAYPDFLKLLATHQSGAAKNDLETAITEYFRGSDFIRSETDDQTNDWIVFDSETLADDAEIRMALSQIQKSLGGETIIIGQKHPFPINLKVFYDDPLDLRSYLPEFDNENRVIPNSFPDPEFQGLFPGSSQAQWSQALSLSAGAIDYTYLNLVQKIYIAYYLRPADPGGLYWWAQQLAQAGGNLNAIIDAYANSDESRRLWGEINSGTIGAVIDAVYMGLFNRLPDAGGKQFYTDGFNSGRFTAGSMVLDILNGAQNLDATAISNKLDYADKFVGALDPDGDFQGPYAATYNANDEQAARNLMAAITCDSGKIALSQVEQDIVERIADAGDTVLK